MAVVSKQDAARFETTKRLLTGLVNEGLAHAAITSQTLRLTGPTADGKYITVSLKSVPANFAGFIRPEMMQQPIILGDGATEYPELDPGAIFLFATPWFAQDIDDEAKERVSKELSNSALFQEKWLELCAANKPLSIKSSFMDSEQSVVYGHPIHPLHRSCFALPPLAPVSPNDIPELLRPSVSIISVPRDAVIITGPFEKMMQPLMQKLDIPAVADDRAALICFTRQLPSIHARFCNVQILKQVEDQFEAQCSIRSLSPIPELQFPYQIKLPLAVQITSAIRTITPWTASTSPIITKILDELEPQLPESLWLFREEAAFCGSQSDFDDAKHLSCILRDDLEPKAAANGESLIIATSLFEQQPGDSKTRAEVVFRLDTEEQRVAWFKSYVRSLFKTVLVPAITLGIAFEAHQQNSVLRVCKTTGEIKGFAIRDYGGIRMHRPTLTKHNIAMDWEQPGGIMITDDIGYIWDNLHHALISNHVAHLVYSLRVDALGGWGIVRDEISALLGGYADGSLGNQLLTFLLRDKMNLKCFLRMRFQSVYRSNVEKEVKNILYS